MEELTDPAGTAPQVAMWGRVTSVPADAYFGAGASPSEGSCLWAGEDTSGIAGNRSEGETLGSERTQSLGKSCY